MRFSGLPVSGRAHGRFRTSVSAAKNPVPGAEKLWWRELRLEAVAAGCALHPKSVNVKKWNQGWAVRRSAFIGRARDLAVEAGSRISLNRLAGGFVQGINSGEFSSTGAGGAVVSSAPS